MTLKEGCLTALEERDAIDDSNLSVLEDIMVVCNWTVREEGGKERCVGLSCR